MPFLKSILSRCASPVNIPALLSPPLLLQQGWLLLQNSWKTKQFSIVDDEYFTACNGELHYIATRQTKAKPLPTFHGHYAESNVALQQHTEHRWLNVKNL